MVKSKWFWLCILLAVIIIWSMVDLFVIVPNLNPK